MVFRLLMTSSLLMVCVAALSPSGYGAQDERESTLPLVSNLCAEQSEEPIRRRPGVPVDEYVLPFQVQFDD